MGMLGKGVWGGLGQKQLQEMDNIALQVELDASQQPQNLFFQLRLQPIDQGDLFVTRHAEF